FLYFFFQAEDGIRDFHVTGVQTCALPISAAPCAAMASVPKRPIMPRYVRKPMPTRVSSHRLGFETRRMRLVMPGIHSRNPAGSRSEERRVGKEGRSRGAPRQQRKTT